jgi:protein SCO1/2
MRRKAAIGVGLIIGLMAIGSALHAAEQPLPVHDGVGGEFSAQSSLGRELRLSEFRDKVVLLFFGYTSCQDVCPATLGHLKALLKGMGPDGERVQVLLVTVDPENDTPENLKKYLADFDPGFIGISGTREEIDRIAKLFLVKHDPSHGVKLTTKHNRHKSPVEQSYLYSHSQQIYLLDKRGRTRGLFFVGSPHDQMREAIRALLNEPGAPARTADTEQADRETTQEQVDPMLEKGDAR